MISRVFKCFEGCHMLTKHVKARFYMLKYRFPCFKEPWCFIWAYVKLLSIGMLRWNTRNRSETPEMEKYRWGSELATDAARRRNGIRDLRWDERFSFAVKCHKDIKMKLELSLTMFPYRCDLWYFFDDLWILSRRVLVYEVYDSGTKRVDTNHSDRGTFEGHSCHRNVFSSFITVKSLWSSLHFFI